MKKTLKRLICITALLVLCMSLVACSSDDKQEPASSKEVEQESDESVKTEKKEIKIGCMSITEPIVEVMQEELEPRGYDVEIVMFDGNHLPATALKNGEIDGVILNHLPWLEKFNKENNCNLKMPEPYMYYSRTAVYSTKHKTIDDLPQNAQIVVPGDPANMERSLIILKDMGLITLGEKTGEFYTVLDVEDNPKNIEIIEAEITATMRSINDVDAVVGGANTAERSGLDPNVFLYEDPAALDFPLGLIVDEKDVDSDWVKEAMEVSQTDEFKEKFKKHYNGTYVLFDK